MLTVLGNLSCRSLLFDADTFTEESSVSNHSGKTRRFIKAIFSSATEETYKFISKEVLRLTETRLLKRNHNYGPNVPLWTFIVTPEHIRSIVESSNENLILVIRKNKHEDTEKNEVFFSSQLADEDNISTTSERSMNELGFCEQPGLSAGGSVIKPKINTNSFKLNANKDDDTPKTLFKIVGCAVATVYIGLTGIRGRFDDFVVDADESGNLWGRIILYVARNYCKDLSCSDLELTCSKARHSAQHLYPTCGFSSRESTCFAFYF